MTASFTVVRTLGRSDVAHDILAELPEWFGSEKYTHEYVEAADRYVNYVAAACLPGGSGYAGPQVAAAVPAPEATRAVKPSTAGRGHVPARLSAPLPVAPLVSSTAGAAVVAPSLVGAPLPVATSVPLLAPAVLPAPPLEVHDAQGILLLNHRYPTSAEVHLLAVRRARHRTGIGRALLAQVEEDLRAQGVRLLSVKTLGPSRPDPEGYDHTRAFYQACGFVPVEEFPDLWPDNPCLLLVKVL